FDFSTGAVLDEVLLETRKHPTLGHDEQVQVILLRHPDGQTRGPERQGPAGGPAELARPACSTKLGLGVWPERAPARPTLRSPRAPRTPRRIDGSRICLALRSSTGGPDRRGPRARPAWRGAVPATRPPSPTGPRAGSPAGASRRAAPGAR